MGLLSAQMQKNIVMGVLKNSIPSTPGEMVGRDHTTFKNDQNKILVQALKPEYGLLDSHPLGQSTQVGHLQQETNSLIQ